MRKKEAIHRQLQDDILQGRYGPGDPIPEREVAEELAVSRIPVREALSELEHDGLVSIVPHRGAYVRPLSVENMQSLYETREALEGMACSLAAERLNPESLVSFKEQYETLLSNGGPLDQASVSALGDDFHDTIIRGSRNSVIIEVSATISPRVQICRRWSYGQASVNWALRAAREHLVIIDAIERADPDLAERRMREHIAAWARFLRTQMAGDGPMPSVPSTT